MTLLKKLVPPDHSITAGELGFVGLVNMIVRTGLSYNRTIGYLIRKGKYKDLMNFLYTKTIVPTGEGSGELIYYFIGWILRKYPELVPYPKYIEIETTTFCNKKCVFCLPEDTMILGSTPTLIKDIFPSDYVFGSKGNKTLVTDVMSRHYDGNLIKIQPRGILPFRLTPEHPVLVSKRIFVEHDRLNRQYVYGKLEYVDASKVTYNHAVAFPKLKESSIWNEPFPMSDEFMEFLGYYLAEGSISTGRRYVRTQKYTNKGNSAIISLAFGKSETHMADRCQQIIPKLFKRKVWRQRLGSCIAIRFSHTSLCKWIENNIGKIAHNKQIPYCVMRSSSNSGIRKFIEAFIDGDGYVHENYIQITSSSLGLMLQMQKLLTRLNIFGRLYSGRTPKEIDYIMGRRIKTNGLYNIRISRPDYDKWMNNDITNKRQYYGSTDDYFLLPIHKISTEYYNGNVYNLETSDHAYEVHNIVVHNCEHTWWDEAKKDLSITEFKSLVDQFKLRWVNLTGEGDAFMNKNYLEMIKYLKEQGISVYLVDSFDLITPQVSHELVRMGVDGIYVSMDSSSKEIYEKIKVGNKFDKVISNLRSLLEIKKDYHSPVPEICFRFVINKLNAHEMSDFINMVRCIGKKKEFGDGSKIHYAGLLDYPAIHNLYLKTIPDKYIKDTITAQKSEPDNLPVVFAHIEDSKNPSMNRCLAWMEPYFALVPHHMVLPCCAVLMSNSRKHLSEYCFGDYNKESMKSIWNHPYYKWFRKTVTNSHASVPMLCRGCRAYDTSERESKYGIDTRTRKDWESA